MPARKAFVCERLQQDKHSCLSTPARPRSGTRCSPHLPFATPAPHAHRARSKCASTRFPEKVLPRSHPERINSIALPNVSAPSEVSAPDVFQTMSTIRVVFRPASHQNPSLSAQRGHRHEIETSRRAASSPTQPHLVRCRLDDFLTAVKSHPSPQKPKRPGGRILLVQILHGCKEPRLLHP